MRRKRGQRGIILKGILLNWHTGMRVWAGLGQDVVRRKYLVLQRGTELHSMRYGQYFAQLMVFNLFEQ